MEYYSAPKRMNVMTRMNLEIMLNGRGQIWVSL